MANPQSFAASYGEARDKFLSAARIAGATTYRYDNPDEGPEGRGPVDRCRAAGTGRCVARRGDDLQHPWRGGLLRLGLPGRLAGQRGRRRPAVGHGSRVRPCHQSLRLRLDAARDGGGQRPQPQLRRPQQALSGERRLSRDRRLSGAGGPQPGHHRCRRRQARRLPQEGGRRCLLPRGLRRSVQPSRRDVLRRRRAGLVEPHRYARSPTVS